MKVNFNESETKNNLMRAFAGESQARNRYTFGSSMAKKENLHVISEIFLYTANQEKEHAEIFYNHLKELSGESITVDGSYPVDLDDDIVKLLRSAQHNEYEEFDPIYKEFGDIAKDEGFSAVAASFYWIADIEKIHGNRFGRFADMIENGELFASSIEVDWICLNCGHVHNWKEAPKKCPVCDHNRGYFIRLELSPYEK